MHFFLYSPFSNGGIIGAGDNIAVVTCYRHSWNPIGVAFHKAFMEILLEVPYSDGAITGSRDKVVVVAGYWYTSDFVGMRL